MLLTVAIWRFIRPRVKLPIYSNAYFKASFKSLIRSSISSRPTEIRINESLILRSFRWSSGTDACVISDLNIRIIRNIDFFKIKITTFQWEKWKRKKMVFTVVRLATQNRPSFQPVWIRGVSAKICEILSKCLSNRMTWRHCGHRFASALARVVDVMAELLNGQGRSLGEKTWD